MKTATKLGENERPNRIRILVGVAVALAVLGAAASAGSVTGKPQQVAKSDILPMGSMMDIRISIEDITGAGEWIEVESFSWGVSQSGDIGGGGGGGAGKAMFQDLNINTHLTHFSPKLVKACATGEHIKKVVLEDFTMATDKKGNETVYFRITLTDVLVSSYQLGAQSGGDTLPMESISFNYAKIEFAYVGSDESLRSSFTYDLKEGREA
jgi:type VI secretion system secreted protein Hcp